jgi:hypothetical protein
MSMNKKQNGIYAMQRRVYNFFTRNLELLSKLPLFPTLYSLLGTTIPQINALNEEQERDLSGVTKQKETLRGGAFKKVMNLQRRLLAFATFTNNEVLVKEISYTDTEMSHLTDNTFLSACWVIYHAAETNQVAAAEYEVTPELLKEVKAAIEAFGKVIDTPKEGQIGKSQTSGEMGDLIQDNQATLGKTDLLVDMLKDSQPKIYKEYYDTRKVVNRSGSLTVKALVTDAATNAPVVDAVVSFRLDGVLILEKTSAEAGRFNVKSMDEGNYVVTTTKMGYQTDVRDVVIVANELNSITIALKKTEAKKTNE